MSSRRRPPRPPRYGGGARPADRRDAIEGALLLVVGLVLLAGVATAFTAARASVPVLVAFLGVGMLLGSEGLGGIEFEDAELARTVGIIGLAAILFEGGLSTRRRDIRPIVLPAALLSTVGVVVTALAAGLAAYVLFDDLPLAVALLLGGRSGASAPTCSSSRWTTARGWRVPGCASSGFLRRPWWS